MRYVYQNFGTYCKKYVEKKNSTQIENTYSREYVKRGLTAMYYVCGLEFAPERYSFLESKITRIGIEIVSGPNLQKFIPIVIGDGISQITPRRIAHEKVFI